MGLLEDYNLHQLGSQSNDMTSSSITLHKTQTRFNKDCTSSPSISVMWWQWRRDSSWEWCGFAWLLGMVPSSLRDEQLWTKLRCVDLDIPACPEVSCNVHYWQKRADERRWCQDTEMPGMEGMEVIAFFQMGLQNHGSHGSHEIKSHGRNMNASSLREGHEVKCFSKNKGMGHAGCDDSKSGTQN